MKESARVYVIVTVMTALIWLLAESEGLRTQQIEFDVRLEGTAAHAVQVAPGENWGGRIEATVRGPSSAIDELRQVLSGGLELAPGAGLPVTTTTTAIALREALRGIEPFAGSGVTLADASPRELRVEVVELMPVRFDVEAEVQGAETEGPPRVSPESVVLRVPRPAVAAVGDDARLLARIPRSEVQGLRTGREERVERVRVSLPPSLAGVWGIAPEPLPTVDVTVTVRDTMASTTLPQVPVQIGLPSIEQPRWNVEVEQAFVRDVTVRGPREVIARLEEDGASDLRVLAFVWLSFEDLERGIDSKEVEFTVLPPIRQEVEFESSTRRVGLTIDRRE